MALDYISVFQAAGMPLAETFGTDFEIVLGPILLDDALRARPDIRSIYDALPELLDIGVVHALRVGQVLGNQLRNRHLLNAQVRVWRDDGPPGKVDTLSRKVATEAALLALEALAKSADRLAKARLVETWHIAIDVHAYLELQEFPLLHDDG